MRTVRPAGLLPAAEVRMSRPPPSPQRPPWRRRLWWGALLAVLLGHVLTTRWLAQALDPVDARPALERMQATYSRVLEASAEPVSAAAPVAEAAPRARRAKAAAPAASAASAAEPPASSVTEPQRVATARETAATGTADATAAAAPDTAASATPDTMPDTTPPAAATAPPAEVKLAPAAPPPAAVAEAAGSAASAQVASALATPGLPAFTWPRSTRLRYALRGWFRGEVTGTAQVEWLRDAERYQVHLDVAVGPSFAPLMTRRMSSEGRLGAEGLVPQRYEQVTRQIIGRDKRAQLRFDDQGVLLDRGERVPTWPDVQDTASQFIQMVYLFTTQPALRAAGSRIEFALALPNRVDRWIYEVGVSELVQTPAGAFQTFHVVPRRAAAKGDLSAEIWYAPTLQMLPVRIRITQDADTWIDLLLLQAPDVAS
jgi:Protein of unknown function (DUF3108)